MKRTLAFDFAEDYRLYMQKIHFKEKSAKEWDARAASMSKKDGGRYVQAFIDQMYFTGVKTVLDIGCGPGSLTLQIAPFVEHVYALDYSQGMLDCLMENAQQQGIHSVTPIHLSKEDVWDNIVPVCDIVICSRSGMDANLEGLFQKIHRFTKQRVYYSHLVGGRFDQPDIAALLDRARDPLPDYIYAMNILYQMGFDPNVSFVNVPGRLEDCHTEDDFLNRMHAQYKALTEADIYKLKDFYQQRHSEFGEPAFGMRWALLNWAVNK